MAKLNNKKKAFKKLPKVKEVEIPHVIIEKGRSYTYDNEVYSSESNAVKSAKEFVEEERGLEFIVHKLVPICSVKKSPSPIEINRLDNPNEMDVAAAAQIQISGN